MQGPLLLLDPSLLGTSSLIDGGWNQQRLGVEINQPLLVAGEASGFRFLLQSDVRTSMGARSDCEFIRLFKLIERRYLRGALSGDIQLL
jgi:hypothetical protein